MVRTNFSVKNLTPERYDDFDIYVKKYSSGTYDRYVVKIAEKGSTTPISTFIHDGPYSKSGYGRDPATKQTAFEEAKERIDQNYAGKTIDKVRVGDLYYESWGYDQTNYDFIIVTEVSDTGKTVKARRTRVADRGSTGQANIQEPIPAPFGDEFRLKVDYYRGEPQLVGSYPYTSDGSMKSGTRRGSFSKHEEGRTYYETDSRFGH